MGHKIDDNIFSIMRVSFSVFGNVKKERHFGRSFDSKVFPNSVSAAQRSISKFLGQRDEFLHPKSHLMYIQHLTLEGMYAVQYCIHNGAMDEWLRHDYIKGTYLCAIQMELNLDEDCLPDVIISHNGFRADISSSEEYYQAVNRLFEKVYIEECNRLHLWYPNMALKD